MKQTGRCFIGWAGWMALMAVLLTTGVSASAQTGAVYGVHDPVLIREGGTWYLFCTGRGVPIRTSADLVHWENAGRVFDRAPEWTAEAVPAFRGDSLWAPDISKVGDWYYLYYSVSTFGKNTSAIGLAVNRTLDPKSPDYHWIDRGLVVKSTPESGWNAIDPNWVADSDGNAWLSWGSFWTGIQLTSLDPETGKPAQDPPKILPIAHRGPQNGLTGPKDENAVEGPFIFRHGDFHYLFISADMCCRGLRSNYKVYVGRSENIEGPYLDAQGRSLMDSGGTLVIASYGKIVHGPGHCAVVRDGDRDLFVHHMYDGSTPRGMSRLQIRPLEWTDDGWPVVGAAVDEAMMQPGQPASDQLRGAWTVWEDFSTTTALELGDSGAAAIGGAARRWTLEGDRLMLTGEADAAGEAPETLTFAVGAQGRWLSGRRDDGVALYAERLPEPLPQSASGRLGR